MCVCVCVCILVCVYGFKYRYVQPISCMHACIHTYILIFDRLSDVSAMHSKFSDFKFEPRFRYKLNFLSINKKLNRESRHICASEIKEK